jgi:hypothetical protein
MHSVRYCYTPLKRSGNYVYSVPYRSKAMHYDSTFRYVFHLILGIISNYSCSYNIS